MAAAPKNRVLIGERVSRAGIDAAVRAELTSEDAVREAIARCDHDAAATRLLARARALGRDAVTAELVAEVLPGLEWWPLACSLIAIAAGDRAGALLAILEKRQFPRTRDALDLETIVLFAAHRAGAPAARVIPELRRLAARTGTVEGYALLATVAAAIDDTNTNAACKPIAQFAREGGASIAETDRALAQSLDQVIAALPADVEDASGAGMTVRAAKPPGRNDPCPCGSGNKYKKCCADKQPAGAPSPIAGVTWDAFLTTSADQISRDHVRELPLRELARIDLTRVTTPVLLGIGERFADARAWPHAERAIAELERRGEPAHEERDELREWLAQVAFDCGESALALRHVAALPDDLRASWAVDLAIADGPAAAWHALVAAADAAVRGEDRVPYIDLAYSLLRGAPALGVLAARACIGALQVDDPDLLLEHVEEVRDQLNLPPTDPAWAVLDTLVPPAKARKAGTRGGKPANEPDDAEAAKLRDSLRDSAARADQLERELAAMRHELAAARTPTPAELQRRDASPGAKDRAGALEAKVAALEGLIREGNAERRDLRRALAAAAPDEPAPVRGRGGASPAAAATPVAPDAEDALGEAVPVMARPVAIPRFDKRAIAALGDVPAAVAAEAMRTIGNLAAGDFPAWRGVKQAKDMPTTVLMARVGIHHRLILRSDGGSLDVVDLVTREQLMTTLKRLRANL